MPCQTKLQALLAQGWKSPSHKVQTENRQYFCFMTQVLKDYEMTLEKVDASDSETEPQWICGLFG